MSYRKKILSKFRSEKRKFFHRRSDLYYKSLYQKHKGEKGFLIGNGPSLEMQDLELIKSQVSIASNRIYLAFDQTSWRPTYYTNISRLQYPIYEREILGHIEKVHLSRNVEVNNLRRAFSVKHLGVADSLPESELRFSPNLVEGAYGGYSVTYFNMQMAIHLGLNPIYLMGMDHFYQGQPMSPEAGSVIKAENVKDHFIDGYRKKGDKINPAMIKEIDLAFEHAKRYAQNMGVEIINVTRGGHLNTFDRASIEEVL